MTTGHNKAKAFINDALDGHLLAAAVCNYFGIKSLDNLEQCPESHEPPLDSSAADQLRYLDDTARVLLDSCIFGDTLLVVSKEL